MTVERGIYGGRKTREGTVVSDKMEKTVVVAVQSNIRHPLYKKTIRRVHKFMAHDGKDQAKLGDLVRIVEAAPASKRKRWQLVEILRRAELPEVAPESIDLDVLGEVKPDEEAVPAETVEAVGGPAVEAVQPEETPEPEVSSEEPAPVLMDAGEEALETAEQVAAEGTAEPAEPEAPAPGDAEPVLEDAAPEATGIAGDEPEAESSTGEKSEEEAE
jgi:small subunit ribosomal protein S17